MKSCDRDGCGKHARYYRQCPFNACRYEIGYCNEDGGDAKAKLEMEAHVAMHAQKPASNAESTCGTTPPCRDRGCLAPKLENGGCLVHGHEKRSCNRHVDCDAADAEFQRQFPDGQQIRLGTGGTDTFYRPSHCRSEDCDECFGA